MGECEQARGLAEAGRARLRSPHQALLLREFNLKAGTGSGWVRELTLRKAL